jgi:hypothetical protein
MPRDEKRLRCDNGLFIICASPWGPRRCFQALALTPTPIHPPESTMNRLLFTVACATGRRLAATLAVQTVAVIGAFQDGAPPGVPVS